MKPTIGILAYGSVISDPREEIEAATKYKVTGIVTPFSVEFARSSRGRAGAPTLVPVESGGLPVSAAIFVVDVNEAEAANLLYRREIGAVGTGKVYRASKVIGADTVIIKRLDACAGIDVVFYTHIAANIVPLTPERLAVLAVESARRLDNGRDGISYLIAAKASGIRTPLSDVYEDEILRLLNTGNLADALAQARASANPPG